MLRRIWDFLPLVLVISLPGGSFTSCHNAAPTNKDPPCPHGTDLHWMSLQVGPPSSALKGKPVDQWGAREVADTVLQDRWIASMHVPHWACFVL